MDIQFNVREARAHLSKLVARARAGEEIVITKAGKPVARLLPVERKSLTRRIPGIDKGKIWMSEDFDAPLELRPSRRVKLTE